MTGMLGIAERRMFLRSCFAKAVLLHSQSSA